VKNVWSELEPASIEYTYWEEQLLSLDARLAAEQEQETAILQLHEAMERTTLLIG
jgi:hypothetical protein